MRMKRNNRASGQSRRPIEGSSQAQYNVTELSYNNEKEHSMSSGQISEASKK